MSDEDVPNNQWLVDAINHAKQSALPLLVQTFIADDPEADVDSTVDAIELALLAITGEIDEAKLREALRPVAELYSGPIGATWESVVDAIVGTLEWTPPDRSTHILDSWGGKR